MAVFVYVIVFNVFAVQQDFSLSRIIETHQEFYQSGFPCAIISHNGCLGLSFDFHVDVPQRPGATSVIAERNIAEFNVAG